MARAEIHAEACAEHQPRQHRPGQRDQERQQRGSADRGPARGGRARLAHRQAAPGEGIGPAGPHRLGRHPPGAHRQRPAGQPEQEPLAHRQQPEDHRLGDGQRGPRVPGHVDQPGQQGHEEGEPEDQPDDEGGAQPLAVERDHQQGRPGRRQRPESGRRERAHQGHPAGQGGQQGPGQPQPVPAQPGQARGDAAGHGGNPPGGGHAAGAALPDLPHGQSVAGYAGLMPPPGPSDLARRPGLMLAVARDDAMTTARNALAAVRCHPAGSTALALGPAPELARRRRDWRPGPGRCPPAPGQPRGVCCRPVRPGRRRPPRLRRPPDRRCPRRPRPRPPRRPPGNPGGLCLELGPLGVCISG